MPVVGPGVCAVCRGPVSTAQRICFACRVVARRLGLPLTRVTPVRLCPLPSPLYTVLLGYKESPVAEARAHFSTIVRALLQAFLATRADELAAGVGGTVDLVVPVPSTHRPGVAPLGLVDGLAQDVAAALPGVRWVPGLLQRAAGPGGSPPVAHMRPNPAAFIPCADDVDALVGARVVLLDDTYVSGARAQSAAAALHRAGVRAARIIPLGRVLRPDRVALHADFLRRHAA